MPAVAFYFVSSYCWAASGQWVRGRCKAIHDVTGELYGIG